MQYFKLEQDNKSIDPHHVGYCCEWEAVTLVTDSCSAQLGCMQFWLMFIQKLAVDFLKGCGVRMTTANVLICGQSIVHKWALMTWPCWLGMEEEAYGRTN